MRASVGWESGATMNDSDDCRNALARLYEFLDHEIDEADADQIRLHLDACEPCFEAFGVEEAVRAVVKRSCGGQKAPDALRFRVVTQITTLTIRYDS